MVVLEGGGFSLTVSRNNEGSSNWDLGDKCQRRKSFLNPKVGLKIRRFITASFISAKFQTTFSFLDDYGRANF